MLLVIFGAGASHDSVPHMNAIGAGYDPERPPLANQLFDGRGIFLAVMEQFRECMEIVPFLGRIWYSVEKNSRGCSANLRPSRECTRNSPLSATTCNQLCGRAKRRGSRSTEE